jgi:hypothetical protein
VVYDVIMGPLLLYAAQAFGRRLGILDVLAPEVSGAGWRS